MGKIVNPQIVIVKGGDTPTPPTTGDYFVKVIDFDGTILKSANLNNGDTFELPTPPSHDGLVFQEWSSSQAITDNKVTINNNNVMIGAVYTTASGLSEFDIELTTVTGLSVTLNMDGTKNWGDGKSDTATTHTYSAVGNYTITCNGTSVSGDVLGQNSSTPNYTLTKVRLSNSVTSIAGGAFHLCYSLTNIVIPNSVTSFSDYAPVFNLCYSLTNIIIPSGVTSFHYNDFYKCYSLTNVVIPSGVTSITSGTFSQCYSLTNIVIPSSVTSIAGISFEQCYSLLEYDFSTFTSVPTLSNTNAFTDINGICKMKIPSALIDEWKTATNWATYADYMVAV